MTHTICFKKVNVLQVADVIVLLCCLESTDAHFLPSLWYKNLARIILVHFSYKNYDKIMKLIKSNFLLLVSFPQYSCVGECCIAVWEEKEGGSLLFIYQLLVDIEMFLGAAQDMSLPKMPFPFEELISNTQNNSKSGGQSLTLGPEIKIKQRKSSQRQGEQT